MNRIAVDHIQMSVENYPRAKAFYIAALKPLGWSLMMEFPEGGEPMYGGFGVDGKPFLWIGAGARQTPPTHTAFGATSRGEVDAFYAAALAAGATDNGPPGIRKDYHPNYYAAFVRDPEGHNIEAVFHGAPAAAPAAKRKPARKAAAKRKPAKRAPARKPATRRKPARRGKKKKAR
jgi:catechol 2,3-dioxygenase-like lactoylglutathione lyase family enzyme